MDRDVKITESGNTLCAVICCEVDHHSAKRIREKIDCAIFESKPQLLLIDFSEVSFMDSSGIAIIIGRARVCEAKGARVEAVGLSPLLMKLVCLAGVDKVKNLTVSGKSNERIL